MKHFAMQNTTCGTDASQTAPATFCAHKNVCTICMTVPVMLFLFSAIFARICDFLLPLSLLALLVLEKTNPQKAFGELETVFIR